MGLIISTCITKNETRDQKRSENCGFKDSAKT